IVLWLEAVGSLLMFVVLACVTRPAVTLPLLSIGALFVLYSFNFVTPANSGRWRLKVFWWGNFVTVFGGYCALWLLGFALAGVMWTRADHLAWVAVAATFSLLDYAVFLNECGLDSADER